MDRKIGNSVITLFRFLPSFGKFCRIGRAPCGSGFPLRSSRRAMGSQPGRELFRPPPRNSAAIPHAATRSLRTTPPSYRQPAYRVPTTNPHTQADDRRRLSITRAMAPCRGVPTQRHTDEKPPPRLSAQRRSRDACIRRARRLISFRASVSSRPTRLPPDRLRSSLAETRRPTTDARQLDSAVAVPLRSIPGTFGKPFAHVR